ncbi:hypothetical protein VB618_04845 [Microvirga sp. CF3062]|uniref:hypothetical protein n=1 Tax=Microvirga sp. CF3062 TaxID=3110182 RepID=UPI002E78804E|nr:hypothetical protein [Microvirga sp. CF3062]MEE1655517.1 hypothetical protein [Microvirga sp. CF3062]
MQVSFTRRIDTVVAALRNWEQSLRFSQGPIRILVALLDRNSRIVEETSGVN